MLDSADMIDARIGRFKHGAQPLLAAKEISYLTALQTLYILAVPKTIYMKKL